MYSILKIVRVHEVIMTGSADQIGTIKYRDIYDQKNQNTGNLTNAKPLFSNITYIPSVNELVHVIAGNSNTSMNPFNNDDKTNPLAYRGRSDLRRLEEIIKQQEKDKDLEFGVDYTIEDLDNFIERTDNAQFGRTV